jgi:hypothetical protein
VYSFIDERMQPSWFGLRKVFALSRAVLKHPPVR